MADTTLYIVEVHEDDCDYEAFESAAVWARDREHARELVTKQHGHEFPRRYADVRALEPGEEKQPPRLHIRKARKTGVVHSHVRGA